MSQNLEVCEKSITFASFFDGNHYLGLLKSGTIFLLYK